MVIAASPSSAREQCKTITAFKESRDHGQSRTPHTSSGVGSRGRSSDGAVLAEHITTRHSAPRASSVRPAYLVPLRWVCWTQHNHTVPVMLDPDLFGEEIRLEQPGAETNLIDGHASATPCK